MQMRKAWKKFFVCTLLVIILLSFIMLGMFYNSSVSREGGRTQVIEEFVRGQRLDLIKNIVNSTVTEINMQNFTAVEQSAAELERAVISLYILNPADYTDDMRIREILEVAENLYLHVDVFCFNKETGYEINSSGETVFIGSAGAFEAVFDDYAASEFHEFGDKYLFGFGIGKDTAYAATVDAMQRYVDSQIPLGDVELRIDALSNYSGEGDFAARIITPFFQRGTDYYINRSNADYYDVLDLIVQNGDAYTQHSADNQPDRIIYARLYRPYDWVISASISSSDIQQLTDTLSSQFREQQGGYLISFLLLCTVFVAAAVAVFIVLGRLFFRTANNEYKAMYDLSHVDALTQVFNRRYLDEMLNNTISFLSRVKNGELSVLMIDVDYFKLYNDTYGHQKGDECLRSIAQALSEILYRATDVTARYGGEEFAVVLPYTGSDGAKIVAGKLLRCVQELNIPHEKSTIAPYVTISIGVISVNVEHTHDYRDYIMKADEALYMSKDNGRNRYTYLDFE